MIYFAYKILWQLWIIKSKFFHNFYKWISLRFWQYLGLAIFGTSSLVECSCSAYLCERRWQISSGYSCCPCLSPQTPRGQRALFTGFGQVLLGQGHPFNPPVSAANIKLSAFRMARSCHQLVDYLCHCYPLAGLSCEIRLSVTLQAKANKAGT